MTTIQKSLTHLCILGFFLAGCTAAPDHPWMSDQERQEEAEQDLGTAAFGLAVVGAVMGMATVQHGLELRQRNHERSMMTREQADQIAAGLEDYHRKMHPKPADTSPLTPAR